jgi:ATP-dependent helicase/nuclease subunit B
MSILVEALAAGATVVTPNNRLARDVAARFDAAQRANAREAWVAAKSLPWMLWLGELWRMALAARVQAAPPALVDNTAARALWHAIVARHGRDWLNSRGAARHAADAWSTFHAWRGPGESLDAVVANALCDDPTIFAQWAEQYRTRLAALCALDDAQLPDVLAQMAAPSWLREADDVVLHGFIALTPQQRRLVTALRGAGMPIVEAPASAGDPCIGRCASFATPRDELAGALGFARARLAAEPQARIAIVVADLDERRNDIVALADEILCPEQALALAADAPRPYLVSLGERLSSLPIVACALDLVALATGPVDATGAACVIRSPFLPQGRERWIVRARVERHWLALGQRRVAWPDVVAALRCDPVLQQRFAALTPPSSAVRLPREWARTWSDWLAALGWPGTGALTSHQWQAREAWSAALAKFAAQGMVTGTLSPVAALDSLRALMGDVLFQPEAPPAQIQILGVLEAAGLSFDHAWLAGFDAQRWPGASAPNPFLPLQWQHARGVPRAHPDSTLAQARQITAELRVIAPEIIVSHAQTIDDAPVSVSPLFAGWQAVDVAQLPHAGRLTDAIEPVSMELWTQRDAPPVAAGAAMRGGATLFESQSACPFQAYAHHRLDAHAFPECPEGLSASERGIILHAMLAAFWDDVGDHATLMALDEAAVSARIDAAVQAGKAKLGTLRWRALAPAIARAEAGRLAATLRAWIDEGERPRPPFRVRAHETLTACEIGGLALRIRIDRIDELAAGGLAIVDYKSGKAIAPGRWFRERPEGLQLAVYAEAVGQTTAEPIRALAYAQVKAGNVGIVGLAEESALWPGLGTAGASRLGVGDWMQARGALHERVAALAHEIRAGVADVAPRHSSTCRYCDLHALCRIQRLDDGAGTPGTDDE